MARPSEDAVKAFSEGRMPMRRIRRLPRPIWGWVEARICSLDLAEALSSEGRHRDVRHDAACEPGKRCSGRDFRLIERG